MSQTTQTLSWEEWRLWGQGYAWSTRYTASSVITVTRNIGSDTATVKVETTMTTPSGDSSLGDWQCIISINGASSGGGEKTFTVASAGYHAERSSFTATQTYTVNVGVSAGTLSGQIKMRIGGYSGYQGEYSEAKAWSLTYDTKGTPSQATWSNAYFGNASTITIQRTVPDFRESVYLVWQDDTSNPVTIRTYSQSSATTISYTIPYNALPTTAQTRSAKIRVVSYNGSTQIGTWETSAVTVTVKSGDTTYLPTLSANPVAEAYNDVVSALGTDTAVAQYSKVNVKANKSDVSLKYSATIASRVVTFSNGSSASADQTNHISSLIQSAGDVAWTYTVTDSRGFKVTRTGTYTVINSSAPSIPPENVTVYRGDSSGNAQDGGAYIYATATATCESLNGHNTVTLQGKVGSGSWQSMTNNTRKTLKSDADANTQYVVTLKATDLLRSTEQTYIVPSLKIPLNITPAKDGMGLGVKGTSGNLNIGYDENIILGKKIMYDNKGDLIRLADHKAQIWATEIPANANLNTATYGSVGQYYCRLNTTVATLTNCPTGDAFTMSVYTPNQTEYENQSGMTQYRVRKLLTWQGVEYVQRVEKNTSDVWTFGAWYKCVDSRGDVHFTGQIKTSFHESVAMGSYQAQANTIPNLVTELRYSSGCCGSVNVTTAYSLTGDTINTGWYNFLWIPHRSGGVNGQASADNTSYGTCILSGMTGSFGTHILRFSNGSIAELRRIVTNELSKDTWTNTSVKNGSAICRRQGNVVSISASGGVSSLSANNYVNWVTIAEKYRPTEAQFVNVSNGVVSGRFAVINTNGVIQLFSSTAITSATNFAFNITYIVD